MDGFISSFISYLYSLDNLDWVMVLGVFLILAGALDTWNQARGWK